MRLMTMIVIIMSILQTFRVSIYYLRKDVTISKKIFETILLTIMLILSFYNLKYQYKLSIYISTFLSIYILIAYIYERFFKNQYISVLSIKNAIDMSDAGIMFLDEKKNLLLINNVMNDILNELNINNDYVNQLIEKSFKKLDNTYLLKCNELIYQLKIESNYELVLYDVTVLYKLQEEENIQNQKIEDNNKKILETINNIEKIDKVNNLLKIKNEYHDMLGHRLALLTKYLENDRKNMEDIKFLLDNIYDDFNEKRKTIYKLNDLIRMYSIVGINININGKLPNDSKISDIFFEIIRESVTNAIIHADSKNIDVKIINYLDKIEMTITNDGKKPSHIICENEGIKGMRRKLSSINGSLMILNDNDFVLKIQV